MNMKIYSRYLSPKSPLSERGLTIATLKSRCLSGYSMYANHFFRFDGVPEAVDISKIVTQWRYAKFNAMIYQFAPAM